MRAVQVPPSTQAGMETRGFQHTADGTAWTGGSGQAEAREWVGIGPDLQSALTKGQVCTQPLKGLITGVDLHPELNDLLAGGGGRRMAKNQGRGGWTRKSGTDRGVGVSKTKNA